MATAEEIKADILEWQNSGQYGPETSLSIATTEFLEALDWRNSEITLPSGLLAKGVERSRLHENDEVWQVFDVNGQLFQVDGNYSSWSGIDWEEDSIHEVEAVQVMVTQYKRKVD